MTVTVTTTAQWIAAGGSVGGALATTGAVVLAYLGLRGEIRRANEQRALDAAQRDQDRRDRRDRESAQARLVLVDVEQTPPPPDQWIMSLATHPCGEVRVEVQNHSREPIFFVRVDEVVLWVHSGRLALPNVADEKPGNGWDPDPEQDREDGPIPAGGSRHWDVIVSREQQGGGLVRHTVAESDHYVVTVAYTDAAGLRWLRTGDEQPRPDPSPPFPRAT